MGVPAGGNLGAARGSIEISTSQLASARAAVQAFATGVNTDLTGINKGIKSAEGSINSLSGTLRGVGVGLGVREIARFAGEVNAVATAYGRQSVAARELAGSQAEVNNLLEAYNAATGNAIDKAQALSDVTRLVAVGFGDSVEEIDQFARAVRGISLATGRPQDFVVTQLQLELLNQTGFRLDQIGLGMEEVRKRADALRTANKNLTTEQAYQRAVLESANQKYGDLTKSLEAQVTGVENLGRAWKDFRLEIGQLSGGPINFIGEAMAQWLDQAAADLKVVNDALVFMGQMIGVINRNTSRWNPTSNNSSRLANNGFRDRGSTADPEGASDIRQDWAQGVLDLQKRTNEELAQQNEDYQRQRADSEEDYQQTILREAEDFATQRQRQEQELADSIADIHEDAARREARAAEDLARNIGRMQADSAERIADMTRDRDERITEAREDSQERLVEMEEDYNEAREKAAESHRLKLLEAAGRLDAKAIYLEQQRFKQQEEDAKESYDEQRNDVKEKLAEQLDDINKSYQERLADEQKALAKSIAQANEAHALQLADARAADAERIKDMQEDFAKRTAQEDADRATRLQRMAEDHQDQLAEMDRAHALRLAQINIHAQNERDELDKEAETALLDLKGRNAAQEAEKKRHEEYLESLWDKYMGHIEGTLTPGHPSEADPYDTPANQERAALMRERDDIMRQMESPLPPSEWVRLNARLQELNELLGPALATVSAVLSSNAISAIGAASVPPIAATSALGFGGNRSVTLGDVHVSVAGTNASALDIAGAVRQEVARLLVEVAG